MPWDNFTGSGVPRVSGQVWEAIPEPPPWRTRRPGDPPPFVAPPKLVDAVNAARHLRRPLLLTGLPGSGESTLVELIGAELQLGAVLRWHVTSTSTLEDALYSYDALGRCLHATRVDRVHADAGRAHEGEADAARFVTLGPFGTALAPADRPRAVLVDEIWGDTARDFQRLLEQFGAFQAVSRWKLIIVGAGASARAAVQDAAGANQPAGRIVDPAPAGAGGGQRLRFRPGVADILQRGSSVFDEWDMYAAVTDYLAQADGGRRDLQTIVADPGGHAVLGADEQPFAEMLGRLSSRLGLGADRAGGDRSTGAAPADQTPSAAAERVAIPGDPADSGPVDLSKIAYGRDPV